MSRPNLLIIAGGASPEHSVSLQSAQNIYQHLSSPSSSISVSLRIISRTGQWLSESDSLEMLAKLSSSKEANSTTTSTPTSIFHSLQDLLLQQNGNTTIVLPLIHGSTGEDGTIQGFLQTLHLPFIGSSIQTSALCLSKSLFKSLARAHNLPQTPFTTLTLQAFRSDPSVPSTLLAKHNLNFPLIIKPSNLGSSIGISHASNPAELSTAFDLAFSYGDKTCILESALPAFYELEVALMMGPNPDSPPQFSRVGKVTHPSSSDFLSFEDKYANHDQGDVTFSVPAQISEDLEAKVQGLARKAWEVFGCEAGLARVDFLVDERTDEVFLNEINTMPGMTQSSHWPRLWEGSGMGVEEWMEVLMEAAMGRGG